MAYSSSLQALPTPLILVIISCISDPETICSLEAVCQDFRAVILQNSDSIWKRLHQHRWKIFATSNSLKNKAEYERRHQLDAAATKYIDRLQELLSSSSTPATTVNNHHRRLVMLDAVMHILSSGKYVLDACWNVWRSAIRDENEELVFLARELLHLLHYYTVCEDLVGLLEQEEQAAPAADATTSTRATAAEDALLEECAILTSKMFYPLDKEGDTMGDNIKSQWIRSEFDRIANMIRQEHFGSFDAPEMNITQKIHTVHKVLFDDDFLTFTGNAEHYYQCDNSLLHVTLKRRKAIPMTLAIIYKCVCRRLGIQVNIIGLPGHIVVHTTGLRGDCQYSRLCYARIRSATPFNAWCRASSTDKHGKLSRATRNST